MLFSSPLFLFLFFPGVLAAYFLAPARFRNSIALVSSILFYAWGEPRFVFVVLASSTLDWLLGRGIHARQGQARARRLVTVGVCANLAILLYFKYTGFFINSVNQALSAAGVPSSLPLLSVALPLGVSFVVFEKITYLVDLYRGTGTPAPSLASYLLYVFFFPKLLAGPIIKYHDIADQLTHRTYSEDDFAQGMVRFCTGLAKKSLIADILAGPVETLFKLGPAELTPGLAWLGLVCFTVQIYFDFSGYSDMAIGMSRMLGFRLMENFNQPYLSASFTEFWRRWHISLSTWIREYLYFPLGGNRVSTARSYVNLAICFLLSGLWHGANWTFLAWGLYQGVFLVLDRLAWLEMQKRVPRLAAIALTFGLVMIGWALFRAESIGHASYYLAALFGITRAGAPFFLLEPDALASLLVGLALIFAPLAVPPLKRVAHWGAAAARPEVRMALASLLLAVCLGRVCSTSFNPFLYFRF